MNIIHISVRNLVELVLRSGSIDSRYVSSTRAVEGTRLHKKLQGLRKKDAKLNNYEYMSEVKILHNFPYKNFEFEIEGRIDGLIIKGEKTYIQEIKTTMRNLENIQEDFNILHWAQAKVYAYIYALQNNMNDISIELTYCNAETEEIKAFIKDFQIGELEVYFYSLLESYIIWAELLSEWAEQRDISIKELNFPYQNYRKNQRELAVKIYRTILNKKKFFVEAPTGTGKTISTLFPAIKAMGEGITSKIFYLTAKTITRQTAEETISNMMKQGLKLKTITITAKEKICFCEKTNCNPEQCVYADGHFDRVNEAILDIFEKEDKFDRMTIEKYAKKYRVCPFEFSVDLTLWADCIICDYNYAFDPKVYLKRFFQDEEENDYIFLIDEAHNLLDRAREMFSADLTKKEFLQVKKQVKDRTVVRWLKKINDYILDTSKNMSDDEIGKIEKEIPLELCNNLRKFINICDEFLNDKEQKDGQEELLELYFKVMDFLRVSEFYDERYVTYIENQGQDLKIKLFCLDPSYLLSEAGKRSMSSIYFSATLTPLEYFRESLGGAEEDFYLKLPSPFSLEKFKPIIAGNISAKWKDREKTYDDIVEYLYLMVGNKKGNYFAFFPSYQYMNKVYELFKEKYTDVDVLMQKEEMTEEEKENFLKYFKENNSESMLAFAVMGGLFSEGIDLVGEKLIGAAIISVGLPKISIERDIILDYYRDKNNKGYEYAYMYPGMNKVLQAAGRVIRTENDRGIVLLIDERFLSGTYKALFPYSWSNYKVVYNKTQLEKELKEFWGNLNENTSYI